MPEPFSKDDLAGLTDEQLVLYLDDTPNVIERLLATIRERDDTIAGYESTLEKLRILVRSDSDKV